MSSSFSKNGLLLVHFTVASCLIHSNLILERILCKTLNFFLHSVPLNCSYYIIMFITANHTHNTKRLKRARVFPDRRESIDTQGVRKSNLPCGLGLGRCSARATWIAPWRWPCNRSNRTGRARGSPARLRLWRRRAPSPPRRAQEALDSTQRRRPKRTRSGETLAGASMGGTRELAIARWRTWSRTLRLIATTGSVVFELRRENTNNGPV